MKDDSIEELTSRLQDLSVQRTYTEETLENIKRETAQVKYSLHIAQSAARI